MISERLRELGACGNAVEDEVAGGVCAAGASWAHMDAGKIQINATAMILRSRHCKKDKDISILSIYYKL